MRALAGVGLKVGDPIADLVASLRGRGVMLWSQNGQLCYRGPLGALDSAELECLRSGRDRILALLNSAGVGADACTSTEACAPARRVPMALSQEWHWAVFQRAGRRTGRTTACAMRLHGQLNVEALRESIRAVVHRHDALRTQLTMAGGMLALEITDTTSCDLRYDDLTRLAQRAREVEVRRLIAQRIHSPIDVSAESLFEPSLFGLGVEDYVLVLATDHMISDAFSLSVLSRDIFTAYAQILSGRWDHFAVLQAPFAEYALCQHQSRRSWTQEHGAYWNGRLAGWRQMRFPEERQAVSSAHQGWAVVPVRIGPELRTELREWCRIRHTTIAMCVFAAYVGLVLRWLNTAEVLVQYQTNGRADPRLHNTVGYFASLLALRVHLNEQDRFSDLVHRVTEEYCNAHERGEGSYLATQSSRGEFALNSIFNWVPNEPPDAGEAMSIATGRIEASPIDLEEAGLGSVECELDPEVILHDMRLEIRGGIYFPLRRFSTETMERFGRNLLLCVVQLIRQPEVKVVDILLV
jgi:hypothetical protein